MKKIALLLALILMLGTLSAVAELCFDWVCPQCGSTDNSADYCSQCKYQRTDESYLQGYLTQDEGLVTREAVEINRIDASSWITVKGDKYRYEASKAIDSDVETCWRFSAKKGLKNKAWISMIIEGQDVNELWLKNGFQTFIKKKYQYLPNARLKDIRVVFVYADRDSETVSFTLPDDKGAEWIVLDTGMHQNVDTVIIYVDSIYKGESRANEVCLTEVMLVRKTAVEQANAVEESQE